MSRRSLRVVLTLVVTAMACGPRAAEVSSSAPAAPQFEAFAIRYATIPFRVAGLIAGADTNRRIDIAMSVWLLRAPGRNVFVDAGFYREPLVTRWRPNNFIKPSDAVARAGVRPEEITDIIVTHVHWDHLDGADLLPNARIWIQREEFNHHVSADGTVRDRAIDAADAKMLAQIALQGRVRLVEGDAKEIIPGITVYTGGKHTFASQFATVKLASGTAVIASDNMYLYENLDKRLPIAQTLDPASNLRAQDRMKTLASEPRLIVPGHDPAVFSRFPSAGNGVARIR
jgi:glyoxylase-like metal-dependent hydrolase (beta-lactamase superfamily II)